MSNSVDPDQTAPIGAVCSRSTLFASILNSSVMLGNYLQQTTSADDIFRCSFWRFKGSSWIQQVCLLVFYTARKRIGSLQRQQNISNFKTEIPYN